MAIEGWRLLYTTPRNRNLQLVMSCTFLFQCIVMVAKGSVIGMSDASWDVLVREGFKSLRDRLQ